MNQKDKANEERRKIEEQTKNNPIKYANSKWWKEIKLELQFDDNPIIHADFITPEEINNYVKLSDNIKFVDQGKNLIDEEA
ncbi:hypothetical protein [Paenibacillus kyungheensis]